MESKQRPTSNLEYLFYTLLVVRKRKRLIAAVGLTTFLAIEFFGYLVTPVWEGTTLILVERASKQNLSIFKDVSIPVSEVATGGDVALDLIPLIAGENMAYDVVRKFGLDEYLREKRQNPPTIRDWTKGLIADVVYSPFTLMEVLGLRPSAEPSWIDKAAEDFIDDSLDVQEEEERTGVINLTVYGETPQMATEIANGMVDMLIERTQAFSRQGAQRSYQFVVSQMEAAERNLETAQDALAKFRADNQIYSLDDNRRLAVERLEQHQTDLLAAGQARIETEARLEAVSRELEQQPEKMVVSASIARNPVIEGLEARLVDLQVKLASILAEKEPEHPEAQVVQAEIDQAEAGLKAAVESVVETQTESLNPVFQQLLNQTVDLKVLGVTLTAREKALKKIIRGLEAEIRSFPAKEMELARLAQVVEINRSVYDDLKTRVERLAVEQDSVINEYNIRVLDRAYVYPGADVDWPIWWLTLIAAVFLGGVFGFGSAFVIEYWNDPVRSATDAEASLGLPLLGRVAELPPSGR